MKRKLSLSLALVSMAAIGSSCIYGQNNTIEKPTESEAILSRLQSLNRSTTIEKVKTIELARKNLTDIQGVLDINMSSRDLQTQACSAYLIGLYHLFRQAPDLANRITLEDTTDYGDGMRGISRPWGRYPAAEALVELGFRSAPSVLHQLGIKRDKKSWLLSLWVLTRISGNQDDVLARVFIERWLDAADKPEGQKLTEVERGNLKDAIVALSKDEQEDVDGDEGK